MNRLSKIIIIMVLPLFVICWYQVYYGQRYQESKLIEVARIGDYLQVDKHLNKGADVNCRDKDGLTPLIWAAIQGHEGIVRVLLERGGDLEAKNHNGDTALMWASVMGHKGVVELLLEYGANADLSEPNSGVTALMAAAAEGHADVAQILMEKGATIDTRDRNGNTALTHASIRGNSDVVELLLTGGATFDGTRPTAVATAFIFVADDGRPAAVELLRFGPNHGGRLNFYPQLPVTDAYLRDVPQNEDWLFTAAANSEARIVPTVLTTTRQPGAFFSH